MIDHVNTVSRAVGQQIRMIGRICHFLCPRDLQTDCACIGAIMGWIFHTLILVGLSQLLVGKLQRCQNMMAHVITLTKKYHHVTPVLKQCHALHGYQWCTA